MTSWEQESAERFTAVARSARANLAVAVDLVLVHNEKPVRGTQPRASLNRAIVVSAVSAWESFVADSAHAFRRSPDGGLDEGAFATGMLGSRDGGSQLGRATQNLLDVGACEADAVDRLVVQAATDWRGVSLRNMEILVGAEPGERSGLTLAQQVSQWIDLRNGLAHASLRNAKLKGDDHDYWVHTESRRRRKAPAYEDPYDGVNGRWRVWASDATGSQADSEAVRMDGGTVQSGSARSCLALFVQLVDWLIVDIATAHSRAWDVEDLRLPAQWFARELPSPFRGVERGGHAHWTLWGGPQLHRRERP